MGRGIGTSWRVTLALAGALLSSPAALAAAEGCPGLVAGRTLPIHRAAVAAGEVGLTYVGHSTFLLESAGGLRIATDYNDYVRPSVVPDVATMNRAHSTHYSNNPDPGIKTIMRGWNPAGGAAPAYDQQIGDVRVRNVVDQHRQWGGDTTIPRATRSSCSRRPISASRISATSITPSRRSICASSAASTSCWCQVDGSYTLDLEGMMEC
jgi:hypothetical protein